MCVGGGGGGRKGTEGVGPLLLWQVAWQPASPGAALGQLGSKRKPEGLGVWCTEAFPKLDSWSLCFLNCCPRLPATW